MGNKDSKPRFTGGGKSTGHRPAQVRTHTGCMRLEAKQCLGYRVCDDRWEGTGTGADSPPATSNILSRRAHPPGKK